MDRPTWLPSPWLLLSACAAGLASGALWGSGGDDGPGVAAPAPPAVTGPPDAAPSGGGAAAPGPAAGGAPRMPSLPGAPPADLLAPLRDALVAMLQGDPLDPAGAARRDEGYEALLDLLDRWEDETGRDPLKSADWWSAALLAAAAPAATGEGGLETVRPDLSDESFRVALWIPPGRATDATPLPVLVTFLEYGMDPYPTLRGHYAQVMETHAIAMPLLRHPREAARDRAMADPDVLPAAVRLLAARHAIDRHRVSVDGHGRGAALATTAAAGHASLLHAAVHRMPWERPALATNLALLGNLILTTESPPGPVADAVAGIRERAWETEHVEAEDFATSFVSAAPRVQSWLAARGPRRLRDQREEFRWAARAEAGGHAWARWIVVDAFDEQGTEKFCSLRLRRDPAKNAVLLDVENVRRARLLLNDALLDLDRPVAVSVNGFWLEPAKVSRDALALRVWAERDPTLFVSAELEIEVPEAARRR